MNQTLSATQMLAKIEEFNQRMHELQSKTDSEQLFIALDARPRSRTGIVVALQEYTTMLFTNAEVDQIISVLIGDSWDADHTALDKKSTVREAQRLLALYAEILGVPVVKLEGGGEYINWTPDTFIDEITV